jgi:uncharacterized repeat protein (TIGR01451 family)
VQPAVAVRAMQPLRARAALRRLAAVALAGCALGLALVAPARPAAAAPQPTLKSAYAGFTDLNGNGVLDCGEPVEILTTFATNNSGTPALNGNLYAPAFGSSGLTFSSGSVVIDPDLTTGCTGTVVNGNGPTDTNFRVDFFCPADPIDNNAWTLVVRYRATYTSTTTAAFAAAAQADTSDGNAYHDTVTVPTGAACGGPGAPNQIAVAKSAAGPATPGTLLVYTLTATDQSGLGAGGIQFVEAVPPHTTWSAAGSSPGWTCLPDATAGSLCRNAAGNLDRNATLSRYFAVTLDPSLPAAPVVIPNTACVRLGPTAVAGCASLATPAAGTPVLHLAKSLAAGIAAPGATLAYALAAANTGNQDLADAVLQETVPAHTTFAAAGSSPGWSCVPGPAAGAACTLDLGPLPAMTSAGSQSAGAAGAAGGSRDRGGAGLAVGFGGSGSTVGSSGGRTAATTTAAVTRAFAVVVDDPLPPLPQSYVFANTACLHAPAGGVADACSTVGSPAAGTPMLHAAKTLRSGAATPGATLVFDLAVQNTGNEGAGAVTASETVPAHTTFAAAQSSPGWTCTPAAGTAGATCTRPIGTLLAGDTAHCLFAVTVDRPLAAGVTSIANTACFQIGASLEATAPAAAAPAAAAPAACDTATTPALGHPLLDLAKAYSGPAAAAGALLSFQLTAANRGDQDAGAVSLTETVPAHTTFVAGASSPGWLCSPGAAAGAACTLALGALAAGGTAAATFAVRADSPLPPAVTQIGNAACAAAAGQAPACGQAATPPPAAAPALAAELQDSFARNAAGNGLAAAGDVIAYALTVSNPGAAAVLGLAVVTPLDPHLTLDVGSVAATAGTITAGNAAGDTAPAVQLPALAAGASFTVSWTATVGALPAGLTLLSTQSSLTAGNLPPTVSDDPDTPEPLDPTTTPVGAPPVAIQSIPTLGTWGLLALVATLGGAALRRLHPRLDASRGGDSGTSGTSGSDSSSSGDSDSWGSGDSRGSSGAGSGKSGGAAGRADS